MLCGCVDIGSNTTRLLVADVAGGRLREVLAERSFTALGRAIGADGRIDPAAVREVAAVVADQLGHARSAGCVRVRVVGTAALRRAVNAAELAAAVSEAAGAELEVLDGAHEARLAFAGATAGLRAPGDAPIAVVDVGGGSCELAVGTLSGGVRWTASLDAGSGSLADACLAGDPPGTGELAALRRAAEETFAGLEPPPVALALAVGGSAGSLRRVAGSRLDAPALERAERLLCRHSAAETARRFDLDARRVRLMPAGLALLGQAATVVGRPLEVADGGLREGVVLGAAA